MTEHLKKIFNQVGKITGKFEAELIHFNELEKNYVYLLALADGNKYVLKIKNSGEDREKEFDLEVNSRPVLEKMLSSADVENYFITKIVRSDRDNLWILFEYAEFETLNKIFKRDKSEFASTIHKFYWDIIVPLLKEIKPTIITPGEFGLNDIGYKNGTFFFYDLEANKPLIKAVVDMYAKLIHRYLRSQDNQSDILVLEKLINEVKEIQRQYTDTNDFNEKLKTRLQTKTLIQVMGRHDPEEMFGKFCY